MQTVLGIDIGGSTTKVVAFSGKNHMIDALQVRAADQLTSLYGAFGRILLRNSLTISDISDVVLTGVGASFVSENLYGIPTHRVPEFEAIGLGGLILGGCDDALVVSMGTGTAFVRADQTHSVHIGGSGIGGGTLTGLSQKLFYGSDMEYLVSLAENGHLEHVDLTIGDISASELPSLPQHATAANFGKIKSTATDSDLALGLMNMVFQTAGMLAVFALMNEETKTVIVTGTLATLPQAKELLSEVGKLHRIDFILPEKAAFATAIGAAALQFDPQRIKQE